MPDVAAVPIVMKKSWAVDQRVHGGRPMALPCLTPLGVRLGETRESRELSEKRLRGVMEPLSPRVSSQMSLLGLLVIKGLPEPNHFRR